MSLRDQLQAIYDEHGRLTPAVLVEVARAEDHPLHDRVFDRTPKDAAEAWYLSRAQDLITSVKVTYRSADGKKARTMREFLAVQTEGDENGGYVYEPAEKVAQDPFLRALVLREMEREWKQLRARYDTFEEFVEMVRQDISA